MIDIIEAALLAQVPKKTTVKFYGERENEILMVAEDIVEYRRTPIADCAADTFVYFSCKLQKRPYILFQQPRTVTTYLLS